jgi:hypothetical protein
MLYPNPATDILILKSTDTFTVTDMNGRIIAVSSIATDQLTQIDVRHLEPGMYCLICDGVVYRFVKQ